MKSCKDGMRGLSFSGGLRLDFSRSEIHQQEITIYLFTSGVFFFAKMKLTRSQGRTRIQTRWLALPKPLKSMKYPVTRREDIFLLGRDDSHNDAEVFNSNGVTT